MAHAKVIGIIALIAVVIWSAVGASAATLGTLASGMFSSAGVVTYPSSSRSISNLTLASTGNPKTVTSLTVTIQGSDLSSLDGQAITVVLLDSRGAQVQTVNGTLAAGSNLTVGGSSATATLAVSGAPLLTSFAFWTVFIAGVQVLSPTTTSTQRVVVTGKGALAAVIPATWSTPLV